MSLGSWGLYGDVWLDLASPTPPRKFRPRRPSYVLATQTTRQRSESCYSTTEIVLPQGVSGGGSGAVPAIAFDTHNDLDDDEDIGGARSLRAFSSPEPDGR